MENSELEIKVGDVEFVRGWVEDLRSGEYLQGTGRLRRKMRRGDKIVDEFCCLGVFCDRFAKQHEIEWEGPTFMRETYGLPQELVPMIPNYTRGLIGIVVDFGPGIGTNSLTELNDSGFTFDQIADVIEWAFLSTED